MVVIRGLAVAAGLAPARAAAMVRDVGEAWPRLRRDRRVPIIHPVFAFARPCVSPFRSVKSTYRKRPSGEKASPSRPCPLEGGFADAPPRSGRSASVAMRSQASGRYWHGR